MKRKLLELLSLLSSALISVGVVYYKIPSSQIQQAIAVLIVILLFFVKRFVFGRKTSVPFVITLLLISFSSTFLQLLVLSSGGFYSPFLMLFHLFAITTSFLVGVRIAIGFLGFSIIALSADTFLDPKLHSLFTNDPWTAALYILSFIVIIPLYQLVSSRYHLSETISKLLTSQLKLTANQLQMKGAQLELTKRRDESLLGGLTDLVVVTDLNLNILSVNEAVMKALKLPEGQKFGQSIFELINLKDMKSNIVDRKFLSIDEIIEQGTTHLMSDLLLYDKNTALPKKINLRIHPSKNLSGQIDQIVFIVSNFYGGGHTSVAYQNIDQAVVKSRKVLEEIKNGLREKGLNELNIKADSLGKSEEDIFTAIQIINHGIKSNISLVDIADIIQRVIAGEKNFAADLGILIDFSFSQQFSEKFSTISLAGEQLIPTAFTGQYFTAMTEPQWFSYLMKKVLDLFILLSSKASQQKVRIFLSYDAETVTIEISCINALPDSQNPEEMLLSQNLENGSGLEGYLIKTISTLINLNYSINYKVDSQSISFVVKLSKTPA